MDERSGIEVEQRRVWDRFAAGWSAWDGLVATMLHPVGEEMIRSLRPADGGDHLEVAAGTGEPGLTIAARHPHTRVTLTDLSEEMLATAAAHARARGLEGVSVRRCGVDELPFDDASFDTIGCRFGFMFFPDIPAAVAELRRVLRPAGRLSAAVWAEPGGNPWATLPMAAIRAEVELPPQASDAPGLFRCAEPGAIARVFEGAGLHDVIETDVRATFEPDTAADYWAFMTEVAAPVVAGLALADDEARERIRRSTMAQVQAFERDGALRLPIHARCIAATR